jgi:soluble lytic murein transglycosylase
VIKFIFLHKILKECKQSIVIGMYIGILSASAFADNKSDLLAAREAFKQGQLEVVADYANRLSNDTLGIYPRYWLLSKQIDQVSTDQVLPFLRYYQGSLLAEKIRVDWLISLAKKEQWALFREQYTLLEDKPTIELQCYAARARIANNDLRGLLDVKNKLWFTSNDLPNACDPLFVDLESRGILTKDDIWQRLRLTLEANEGDVSQVLAERLGETLTKNELQKISESPQKFLTSNVFSSAIKKELVYYALTRLARKDLSLAEQELNRLLSSMDDIDKKYAWRRLAVVAAFNLDKNALSFFEKSEDYPWTEKDCEWHFRSALRAQSWPVIVMAINAMPAAQQQEKTYQYWKARALEILKKPQEANKIFADLSLDDDYYGLLSRDRLGALIGENKKPYVLMAADKERVKKHPGLQRALLLKEAGFSWDAAREWNWALRMADDRLLLAAADAAMNSLWYDRAIYAAERSKQFRIKELSYVAPFRSIVQSYAKENNLEEAWVYGLMRQESRFVSEARSGVGASGLMQLMPQTAQWVAKRLKLKYHSGMTNDAGANVQLGTYYLKHVQENLSNSPVLATAAYNAGPSRAKKWQSFDKSVDATIYIDAIPFSETRDYVKKVMTNAVHYSWVLEQSRKTLTERIGLITPAMNADTVDLP